MTTTFETAKTGDRVYDFTFGWGGIVQINPSSSYPIKVRFHDVEAYSTYSYDGCEFLGRRQTLFWGDVSFDAPCKPLPDLAIDTKLWVRMSTDGPEVPRHFAGFNSKGQVLVFMDGATSFSSTITTRFNHWRLAE